MVNFSSLFKKENISELVLSMILIVYLILGFKLPQQISDIIGSLLGKITLFAIVIYLFMKSNTILAILFLLVAFHLISQTSITEFGDLQRFVPSEQKKNSQFTAYIQFPYTLEQEVVSKMSPIMKSGVSLTQATYKPLLDKLYDASPVNA